MGKSSLLDTRRRGDLGIRTDGEDSPVAGQKHGAVGDGGSIDREHPGGAAPAHRHLGSLLQRVALAEPNGEWMGQNSLGSVPGMKDST